MDVLRKILARGSKRGLLEGSIIGDDKKNVSHLYSAVDKFLFLSHDDRLIKKSLTIAQVSSTSKDWLE